MRAPTVLYVRRSDVHANPPTDDSFRVVLAMDAEEYQGQLQARVRELEERWEKDNLCGICPYREAIQARVRELEEAVIGAAKLVDAIGQWFIREEPDVPKWFEDAVLEIERTTRAALVPANEERVPEARLMPDMPEGRGFGTFDSVPANEETDG